MISPPGVPNRSSGRILDHVGQSPPSADTCHFPPGPGNGRTYTSERPDSFESYARKRPSGEKAAPTSTNESFFMTTETDQPMSNSIAIPTDTKQSQADANVIYVRIVLDEDGSWTFFVTIEHLDTG